MGPLMGRVMHLTRTTLPHQAKGWGSTRSEEDKLVAGPGKRGARIIVVIRKREKY